MDIFNDVILVVSFDSVITETQALEILKNVGSKLQIVRSETGIFEPTKNRIRVVTVLIPPDWSSPVQHVLEDRQDVIGVRRIGQN
jgi:hypothetical protein